ncbi:MAG: ZIP family metal transporter [Flavobacteriales bacterium]|nr:ZIP family metal transporter [Flavobacteriales bacterium]
MELVILFVCAFVGGLLAWAFKVSKENMKIVLAFSGAFMLGLSFFHVLPESYELLGANAGIWVLAGFMAQIVLEVLSKGMEHGHAHALHGKSIPVALFFGLGIHALLEGLPFGGEHAHQHHSLLAGVLIHKVPVAFILGTVLRGADFSIAKGALALFGFAAMAPLGGLITHFMEGQVISVGDFQGVILAVLVGIFLHIATTIIFESDKGHAFNLTKLVAILLGFVLAFVAV